MVLGFGIMIKMAIENTLFLIDILPLVLKFLVSHRSRCKTTAFLFEIFWFHIDLDAKPAHNCLLTFLVSHRS